MKTCTTRDCTRDAHTGDGVHLNGAWPFVDAEEQDLVREHSAGEHFDDIVLDCPPCAKEWAEITGKPEGVA